MKSFTPMFLAASAITAYGQATYNSTTGQFTCAIANAAYCADGAGTNIIIRCNGFVGQPGNCNDNLDGEFPPGLSYAPCYETSSTSGDAACTKNCVIYGGSGNYNGTLTTVPGCVPTATQSSSSSTAASTTTSTSTSVSTPIGTLTSTSTVSESSSAPPSSSVIISSTQSSNYSVTLTHPNPSTTTLVTTTEAPAPPTTTAVGTVTGTGVTPVGPTVSSPMFTGAAVANTGSFIAGVGIIFAYFL